MDNLKTNHRGTFVLLDASHRPLRALSGDAPLEEAAGGQEVGGAPVWLPQGILHKMLPSW